MIAISGNETGNLDGVYTVRQMMGADSDLVTVVLEKGKAVMSLNLPFDSIEFSQKVEIQRNSLTFLR
jgi:hypothetical protein